MQKRNFLKFLIESKILGPDTIVLLKDKKVITKQMISAALDRTPYETSFTVIKKIFASLEPDLQSKFLVLLTDYLKPKVAPEPKNRHTSSN